MRVTRQIGVLVAIARWWHSGGSALRRLASRPAVATSAILGLVLVIALAPDAGSVDAASLFDALRAPGQAGFVAGHRGDKDGAPENTLPAFELAINSNVAFVETDIQLTSDGVPVLMHDWTVDRTTDGTGPVWNMTYDQISRLDAGSWYGPQFAGTRVPTLEQLLFLLQPTGKHAILELKGAWTEDQTQTIADLLYEYGVQGRVILAGFDLVTLQALEQRAPDVPRVVITHAVIGDPAVLAKACGAIAIVTSLDYIRSDPGAVARIHDEGLGVLLYTLNDTDTWAEAVALGVDGLITDKPVKLDTWLARSASGAG